MPWKWCHLREGSRSFQVRRPKGEEGYPEVHVRGSPEDLTLRAEEVGTQKSCINVDHIAKERWRSAFGRRWLARLLPGVM